MKVPCVEVGIQKKDQRIKNPARIVDEDKKLVAAFDGTVPHADARSGHFPLERYKSVTCLNGFKFLSIERAYAICKLGRCNTTHVRALPERDVSLACCSCSINRMLSSGKLAQPGEKRT